MLLYCRLIPGVVFDHPNRIRADENGLALAHVVFGLSPRAE
jgi:hypothetical protein